MKLAVIFPGIGYHVDKPLLYYSAKIAKSYGYEIRQVPYGGFPEQVRGSKEKMQQSFELALQQTRELLKDIDFDEYGEILFISKSVGTAVSGAYAKEKGISPYHIFYTPIEATFQWISNQGIVFHGTADPWVETSVVMENCERLGLPLYITEDANHSLETGKVEADLKNMQIIMEQTERAIMKGGENMTEKEMLKISVEEFSRLQRYMMLITDKGSEAYKAMKERYIDLKVILTSSGINLTEIDRIKE